MERQEPCLNSWSVFIVRLIVTELQSDERVSHESAKIAGEVGYCCSIHNCLNPTIGLSDEGAIGFSGRAVPILESNPSSPRFDEAANKSSIFYAANLVWLCKQHADDVDRNPDLYTIDRLTRIAVSADSRAERFVGNRIGSQHGKMVAVSPVSRVGSASFATTGDKKIASAPMIDLHSNCGRNARHVHGYAVEFQVQKLVQGDTVFIDKLFLNLARAEPAPEHVNWPRLSLYESDLFVAEIDDYIDATPKKIEAKHFFRLTPNGGESRSSAVALEIKGGFGNQIVLRINAKKPGVYTFSVVAKFTCNDESEELKLCEEQSVLFF